MAIGTKIVETADDGTHPAISIADPANTRRSHMRTLYVYGTFDGATFKLQASPDNSNWFDVTGADAITSATMINVELRASHVRAVISGSVTAASITAVLA